MTVQRQCHEADRGTIAEKTVADSLQFDTWHDGGREDCPRQYTLHLEWPNIRIMCVKLLNNCKWRGKSTSFQLFPEN